MLISVDLPAPFSPTMPVIEPRRMVSETSQLAWTLPKRLSIWRSSIAGGESPTGSFETLAVFSAVGLIDTHLQASTRERRPRSIFAVVMRHVVVDLDLAGDDVRLGLLDLGLHLRRDQLL